MSRKYFYLFKKFLPFLFLGVTRSIFNFFPFLSCTFFLSPFKNEKKGKYWRIERQLSFVWITRWLFWMHNAEIRMKVTFTYHCRSTMSFDVKMKFWLFTLLILFSQLKMILYLFSFSWVIYVSFEKRTKFF